MASTLGLSYDVTGKQTKTLDVSGPASAKSSFGKVSISGSATASDSAPGSGETGTCKVDLINSGEVTVDDSTGGSFSIASFTDFFGATKSFAKIKALTIKNVSETAAAVTTFLDGTSDEGFKGPLSGTDSYLTIPAGEVLVLANTSGWTVGAGVTDILFESTADQTLEVIVYGEASA